MLAVLLRHKVVHRGQEPVRRADVGQHFDFRVARQLQPPVALPGARAARQTLGLVSQFQIVRVERRHLVGTDREGERLVLPEGVVEGLDAHLADSPERFTTRTNPCRPEESDADGNKGTIWLPSARPGACASRRTGPSWS